MVRKAAKHQRVPRSKLDSCITWSSRCNKCK